MIHEKTADVLETAAHLHEQLNESGVAAARKGLESQCPKDKDGNRIKITHCVEPDCGEELPPNRIEDGRIRCTSCQVAVDARAKLRGR